MLFPSVSELVKALAPCATALALVLLGAASTRAGEPEVKETASGLMCSVRVPDGWNKESGGLLVVGFYGRGDRHARFMTCLTPVACLASAVLVVPEAPNAERAWQTSEDLPKVERLLKQMRAEHGATRTVVVGFSQGSFMCAMAGVAFPELVDAAIPMSGGGIAPYPVPSPARGALRRQAFYVIHGELDPVIPVDQARKCVATFEGAGLFRVRYEEIAGLGHAIDWNAFERAFAWVERVLPAPARPLGEDVANERLAALGAALKTKDGERIASAFASLAGAPASFEPKIAPFARASAVSADEKVALAATLAASRLCDAGVGPLEAVPVEHEAAACAAAAALPRTGPQAQRPLLALLKAKPARVALAATEALAGLGTKASLATLVSGLRAAEEAKVGDERVAAIKAALEKLTGQSFETAKEWRAWVEGQGKR